MVALERNDKTFPAISNSTKQMISNPGLALLQGWFPSSSRRELMLANYESWQKQVKGDRMRPATSLVGVPDLRERGGSKA
jgi:hypothetical protein